MNMSDMDLVDEQLTAYLDGELSAEEASAVERSLVGDEKLRLRLAELRKAYDLLDEIPETPHNQRFTKSTLELVVKDLSQQSLSPSSSPALASRHLHWWSMPRFLAILSGFMIAGSVAALTVSFVNARRELRSLGLIAGVRGLEDVSELEIAIKLNEESEAIAFLKGSLGDKLVPAPPDSVWQRKTWVQSLTSRQVSALDSNREQIRRLDREKLTHLTAMEAQIENLPDHKKIQETVHVIGVVIDGLGNSKRLDMESMKSDQRYKFLKEQIYLKAAEQYAEKLSAADVAALEKWDNDSFRPALIREVNPSRQATTRELLGTLIYRRFPQRDIELDEQEELIAELTANLSTTGKKLIEGVSKAKQMNVLNVWLFPTRTSTTVLLEGYEKMNPDLRDRIDLLDPQLARRAMSSGGSGGRGPRRP